MKNLNELEKALENKIPLVWYDTSVIENKQYKINH